MFVRIKGKNLLNVVIVVDVMWWVVLVIILCIVFLLFVIVDGFFFNFEMMIIVVLIVILIKLISVMIGWKLKGYLKIVRLSIFRLVVRFVMVNIIVFNWNELKVNMIVEIISMIIKLIDLNRLLIVFDWVLVLFLNLNW